MFLVWVRMVFRETISLWAISGPFNSVPSSLSTVQLTFAQWLDGQCPLCGQGRRHSFILRPLWCVYRGWRSTLMPPRHNNPRMMRFWCTA